MITANRIKPAANKIEAIRGWLISGEQHANTAIRRHCKFVSHSRRPDCAEVDGQLVNFSCKSLRYQWAEAAPKRRGAETQAAFNGLYRIAYSIYHGAFCDAHRCFRLCNRCGPT